MRLYFFACMMVMSAIVSLYIIYHCDTINRNIPLKRSLFKINLWWDTSFRSRYIPRGQIGVLQRSPNYIYFILKERKKVAFFLIDLWLGLAARQSGTYKHKSWRRDAKSKWQVKWRVSGLMKKITTPKKDQK